MTIEGFAAMPNSIHPQIRRLHLYGGLILLAPLLVVGATGVLLNHAEPLGLKPAKYGRRGGEAAERAAEAFTAAPAAWRTHAAEVDRALTAAAERWGNVPLEHIQIKNEHGCGLVVKLKARGPVPAGCTRELVWSIAENRVLAAEGGPNWLADLHTGRIFSHTWGFLWSDIAGVTLVVLAITGVVLYCLPWLRRRAKARPRVREGAPP